MGLLRRAREESRYTLDDIYEVFTKNGSLLQPNYTWPADGKERVGPGYASMVSSAYDSNGVVFAVILARLSLFSEAVFKFRQMNQGRPGDLFGTPDLGLLETPWPNATTQDLLARMEQDASLAGNFYGWAHDGILERLRPDFVEIVTAAATEADLYGRPGATRLVGYIYYPTGPGQGGKDGLFLTVDEVAHYAPIPDPLALYAGMSWLTPVRREIEGDSAMTRHKNKFFEHAATPNMLIKLQQKLNSDAYERLEKQLEQRHAGIENAYKVMLLEGGADATVIGNNFEQMTFTDVQAAGENRIAAAAGVPGIVVGLKEGLQAATYSNYGQAMRRFVDVTMRPNWRKACGALATVIKVPQNAQLWYDDRDIPALRQDAKEQADILVQQAAAIRQLIDGGYTPESAVAAIKSGDLSLLKHSGWLSVQLWLPGQGGKGGESPKAPAADMPPGAESPKAPDGSSGPSANGTPAKTK